MVVVRFVLDGVGKQGVQSLQVVTKDSQRTVGEYPTKREAVAAMMAMRQPATRITKVGHGYVFHEAKQ